MYFLKAPTFLLSLAVSITCAQQLNRWRETLFPIAYSALNSSSDNLVDGNPNTTYRNTLLPYRITLLFNRGVRLKGFYVKSSGNYITDYHVEATDPRSYSTNIVGSVSAAQSDFTAVNFWDLGDQPSAYGINWYLTVTQILDKNLGIYRNTSQTGIYGIDEIYPIYPEDDIAYPPGQTPGPIPTQTNLPTITQTSLPQYPGIKFNQWPRFLGTFPDVWKLSGGTSGSNAVDNNPATSSWQPIQSNGRPTEIYITIIDPKAYSGFYILSDLKDYAIMAQNMATDKMFEVCRVTGFTKNLSVCHFVNEKGEPFYKTNSFRIIPIALQGESNYFNVDEIYAIYPGDEVVKLEDL